MVQTKNTTNKFYELPDRQGPRHCNLQTLELELCHLHLCPALCHPHEGPPRTESRGMWMGMQVASLLQTHLKP